MSGERGDARKRGLAVPCCDAAAKVARVEALAERWKRESDERGPWDEVYTNGVVTLLCAALDGPAGGGAA